MTDVITRDLQDMREHPYLTVIAMLLTLLIIFGCIFACVGAAVFLYEAVKMWILMN